MTITIVGAGIVGCAIAHELASRGARVRVVDPREPGGGATRASAGILAPYVEGHIPALLTLGVRSLALYDDFIRRVSLDSNEAIEYEPSGTLQVALNSIEAQDLCALAGALAAASVAHSLLDGRDALVLEPSLPSDIVAALFVPAHAYVAVGPLTRALAAAATTKGAAIWNARVTRIEGGETPTVHLEGERLLSDAIVIAAGSWSGELAGNGLRRAVRPIRGQLLHVRLDRRPAERVIWGSGCYAVPWRSGSVLIGATVEDAGFNETATVEGVHDLLAAACRLMPVLRGAAFQEVRVGLRPMTADELPAIGPSSTMRNVFYATGHYRNGILLAPLTASLVADLVLDGRETAELALTRPGRLGL